MDQDRHSVARIRQPPSPESVVVEFAALMNAYGVYEVTGDRWGGEWLREAFAKLKIRYVVSERTKSAIYVEFLPLLNSGRAVLLDHPRLIAQLCTLERRTGRGTGKDAIDHPVGGHDDVVNAAAGALVLAASGSGRVIVTREMAERARMRPPRRFGVDGYRVDAWAAIARGRTGW